MTETIELIAQINTAWRVVRIAGREGWGPPCWHIQNVDDPRAGAVFRMKHMVLEFVKYKCGTITPEAQAVIDALPDRCDRPDPPKRIRIRPARPAGEAPAATVTNPPAPPINAPSPRIPPVTPPPDRLATIRAVAKRLKRLDEQATL
jgi:hypothetical protein